MEDHTSPYLRRPARGLLTARLERTVRESRWKAARTRNLIRALRKALGDTTCQN